jgi:hypothetical protein
MKPACSILRTVASACAAGLAFMTPVFGEDETSYWVEIGGEARAVEEDRDSKFQDFRDVPQGAILDAFHFDWRSGSSPWSVSVDGLNAFRLDEHYTIDFERAGRFSATVFWDRIPRFFSHDSTWLLAGSPGNYTLSDVFRQEIEDEATVNGVPGLETLIPEVLGTSARPIDLRLNRDRAGVALNFPIGAAWDLSVFGSHEKREGLGRISTGTYIRSTTAASFDGERFTIRGLELPDPIDFRTTDVGVTAAFRKSRGFFRIGWQGAEFENNISTLRWDNPFEAPASVSSSSLGLFTGAEQEPSAAQGNTSGAANRGRSEQGALDLWPDNTYDRFHAEGGVSLPGRTRINAGVSLATMEQDDPFLPYTVNESICFFGSANNICDGEPTDILAVDAALPRASLGGEIRTTRGDFIISSRPIAPLTLRGSFRHYDYDDRSPSILFPGYAAAGESYFRPGIGQRDATNTRVLFNVVGGYTRDAWTAGGAWRFGPAATIDLEYGQTTWDYDERQVEGTTEDLLQARLFLKPAGWFSARLSWLDASRDFDGVYDVGFETSGVRAYDVWNRDRTRVGAEFDFTPGDRWTFGIAWADWKDEFPGSVDAVTPHPYGLNLAESDSITGTLGYGGDRCLVTVTVGHDTSTYDSLMVTKTSITNSNYQATNRWTRTQDDTLNWAGVYFEAQLIKDRLRGIVDLSYVADDGSLETVNLGTPDINSAVAYPFPDFRSDLFAGRLALLWTVNPNIDLALRYWHEPYRLDDFMWDQVQPYMQGVVQEARTSPADVQDADVSRYLTLDSRYSDYTAKVLSLWMRLQF